MAGHETISHAVPMLLCLLLFFLLNHFSADPNLVGICGLLQVQTHLENPTKYHIQQAQRLQVKEYLSHTLGNNVVIQKLGASPSTISGSAPELAPAANSTPSSPMAVLSLSSAKEEVRSLSIALHIMIMAIIINKSHTFQFIFQVIFRWNRKTIVKNQKRIKKRMYSHYIMIIYCHAIAVKWALRSHFFVTLQQRSNYTTLLLLIMG